MHNRVPRITRLARVWMTLLVGMVTLALLVGSRPAGAQSGTGWELEAGSRVHTTAVAADGSAVVVGSRDGIVYYLDRAGKQLWTYDTKGTVLGLAISQDGKRVVAATESRKAFLLDETGQVLWEKKYKFVLVGAAISGNGDLIALIPKDKEAWLLDAEGNTTVTIPYDILPTAVAISQDGQRIAIGTRDAHVRLYDRGGGKMWETQLDGVIRGLGLSQDGSLLAIGDESSKGYLIKIENNAGTLVWNYEAGDKVDSAAISSDGQVIALGSRDKKAYLMDSAGQVKSQTETGGRVYSVALSGDGTLFVVGSEDGKAYGSDVKEAQTSYSTSQTRNTILWITIPLGVLAVIFGAVAYLRYTPSGKQIWEVQGVPTRKLLKQIWRARVSYLLLLPTVTLLVIFNYYPAFSGLFHSFTKWVPGVETRWIGLENFVAIRYNEFFWGGLWNALILIVTGFLKVLTIPLLVAELLFAMRNRFTQYWLRSLFIFPIVVPGVAIILVWRNILDPNIGLLNNFLSLIGMMDMAQPQAWLGDTRTAIWSIVFIGFPWVSPFALLLYYGGLISIPIELFDAAKVDGANAVQRFWYVDLPLLLGQIKLLLIMGFIGGMQEFSTIFLTTEGGPYNATYTPALELYYQAMRFSNYGVASAMGTVLFIFILGGTILNLRMRSSAEYQA